jgi:hypothetical protein
MRSVQHSASRGKTSHGASKARRPLGRGKLAVAAAWALIGGNVVPSDTCRLLVLADQEEDAWSQGSVGDKSLA